MPGEHWVAPMCSTLEGLTTESNTAIIGVCGVELSVCGAEPGLQSLCLPFQFPIWQEQPQGSSFRPSNVRDETHPLLESCCTREPPKVWEGHQQTSFQTIHQTQTFSTHFILSPPKPEVFLSYAIIDITFPSLMRLLVIYLLHGVPFRKGPREYMKQKHNYQFSPLSSSYTALFHHSTLSSLVLRKSHRSTLQPSPSSRSVK